MVEEGNLKSALNSGLWLSGQHLDGFCYCCFCVFKTTKLCFQNKKFIASKWRGLGTEKTWESWTDKVKLSLVFSGRSYPPDLRQNCVKLVPLLCSFSQLFPDSPPCFKLLLHSHFHDQNFFFRLGICHPCFIVNSGLWLPFPGIFAFRNWVYKTKVLCLIDKI